MKLKIVSLICSIFAFVSINLLLISPVFNQHIQFDATVKNPAYEKDMGPKVLFDEGHHNHHTSTVSYKAFVDVIVNDGYVLSVNKKKFAPDILKGSDILVISNAMDERNVKDWTITPYYPAFAQDEVEAVHSWVKEGGGLFLIADHEPFGTAAFDLAQRFGIVLSKGRVFDPKSVILFSREKRNLLEHPVTKGRNESEKVERIKTFTGESLQAPEGSGFMKLSDAAYDLDPLTKKKRPVPGNFQGVAFAYGKGRIVVLGEAAMVTVQRSGMRMPEKKLKKLRGMVTFSPAWGMVPKDNDNKKLLLNLMHYLSKLLEPGISVS